MSNSTQLTGKLTEVVKLRKNYSGGQFDRLNADSQVLTAIAWDNHPSQAFYILVDKIAALKPEWGSLIREYGLNYYVIAEGDSFCASGFKNFFGIACDTEEWYADIEGGKDAFKENGTLNEELWDKLQELIDAYSGQISDEVTNYLEKRHLVLKDIQSAVAGLESA